MTNLTILTQDNAVYLDGAVILDLDLSTAGIPSNVHALQWKTNVGWIEFKPNDDFTHDPNQIINELPNWANNCINIFKDTVVKHQAEQKVIMSTKVQPTTTGTTIV